MGGGRAVRGSHRVRDSVRAALAVAATLVVPMITGGTCIELRPRPCTLALCKPSLCPALATSSTACQQSHPTGSHCRCRCRFRCRFHRRCPQHIADTHSRSGCAHAEPCGALSGCRLSHLEGACGIAFLSMRSTLPCRSVLEGQGFPVAPPVRTAPADDPLLQANRCRLAANRRRLEAHCRRHRRHGANAPSTPSVRREGLLYR